MKALIRPKLTIKSDITYHNRQRLLKRNEGAENMVQAEKATQEVLFRVGERYIETNKSHFGDLATEIKFITELKLTSKAMESPFYALAIRQFQGLDIDWNCFEETFAMRLQARLVSNGVLESEHGTLICER